MELITEPTVAFAYRAQARDGQGISGTIEAADIEQAQGQLESLQLRVIEIALVQDAAGQPAKGSALKGDDFIAFNQQLGYLAAAGLPIDRGLRLIGEDMRRGKLARTVKQIADELDKGLSLREAFDRHQKQFPAMYGRLIEAGVTSKNLAGMLFNLAEHLDMVRRLRGMLWRSIAYPLMVFVGITLVSSFLGWYITPAFQSIFMEFKVSLPQATHVAFFVSRALPAALVIILALLVAVPVLWAMLKLIGMDRIARDALVLPLPLIGAIIKKSLLAGWCNAVRLGIEGGLDLPRAIALAGDTGGSPALRDDGLGLINVLEQGLSVTSAPRGRVIPPIIPAAIAIGIANRDLPGVMRGLAEMYQQQAESRLGLLPGVLTPLLLIVAALMIGAMVVSIVLPLLTLMRLF